MSPIEASTPEPSTPDDPAAALQALRVEIDRIDAGLHEALIERSGVIDRLIAIKARQGGGSAFRPGREAEMMRRLVERHRGRLPLDTVESIWRVIISTFTFVQAAYAVHADMASDDAAMRDCARFHFGFTVPLVLHRGAGDVIAAVTAAETDLGLLPVGAAMATAPWWKPLLPPDAPKIIARLPFVDRPNHPAGLPVFVIAKPLAVAAVRDVVLYGVEWVGGEAGDRPFEGWTMISSAETGSTRWLLMSPRGDRSSNRLVDELSGHSSCLGLAELGSHAAFDEIG